MLYNKKNFQVVDAAADTDLKPKLTGIYLTPSHTVATDSFILARVSVPKGQEAKDFPQPATGDKMKIKQVRAIVKPEVANKMIKNLPKDNNLPILENAVVKQFKKEQDITFAYTDLETWNENTSKVIEGEFPEYENVIPKGKPKAKISVNYNYLIKALKIAGRTTGRLEDIEVEIHGSDKPIVIRSKDSEQDTLALVMPLRE